MTRAASHTLELGDTRIPWRLTRSKRRTLAIHVRNGQVEVRSPLQLAEPHITRFVAEKAQWIQQRLAQQSRQQQEAWRPLPGRVMPYLGRDHTVEWRTARRGAVSATDGRLVIAGPALDETRALRILNEWLKGEARHYMEPRIHRLATDAGLAHRISAVRWRRTRSKWGHCTATGVLQFNWLVMLAPAAVIDYLIAHEVSHLRHLNHSPAFWNQVAQLCPDHRELRHWLRSHQHRFAAFYGL